MASTISFKKAVAAPAAAQTPVAAATPVAQVPSTAVAVQSNTALAAQTEPEMDYQGVGGFKGEFSAKDVATTYLSIFQKSSKNFEENMDWLGQWVYGKEIPLGTELKIIFTRASKYYLEKTEYGSDQIPMRFVAMKDARAAGFNESNLQEAADLDLVIEVDADAEGVADKAVVIFGDKAYVRARYTVRSTAYGRTVGIIARDTGGYLKGNLLNGFYQLTAEKRTSDKGTYYSPLLKAAGVTPVDLRNALAMKLRGI